MRHVLLFAFAVTALNTSAQNPTWAGEIAGIFYANCTACHRDGGIAPFSLVTHEEAIAYGDEIEEHVLVEGHMPPWSPDTTYQRYSHERILTANELQNISDWLANGMPSGDLSTTPPPPVYNDSGFISLPPDLELSMPLYTSQATANSDDYSCFALPTGLLQNKKIRAFEVIPGNHAIVHHCLVYVDAAGTYQTNTNGFCTGPNDGLLGGYTPGSTPTVFPSNGTTVNMGYTLPAGSKIVFAMHYPNYSMGEQDQTKIRFWFYPDATPIREITTEPILQNWSFNLPANQVTEVTANWNLIPVNMSILSVFPHMHLLGKDIEAYGLTPQGDTLKFARIPHWDFHWQQFYFFQNIIKVPAGSTLHSRGTYDNTIDNPHNPHNPPVNVGAGLNTSDEMFLVYFHYLPYVNGDELLDLESMTQLSSSVDDISATGSGIRVFPNPASQMVTFELDLEQNATVSVFLYDLHGRLVERMIDRVNFSSGKSQNTLPVNQLKAGTYFWSAGVNGRFSSGKLVVE